MLFLTNKFTNILLTYLVRIKKVTRQKATEKIWGIDARFSKKVTDSSQLILSLFKACFIYFNTETPVMGRTEISRRECKY